MSQPVLGEDSELYKALRLYTIAALQLLSQNCPEAPPAVLRFVDDWRRDSDGQFRLYDQSRPYWMDCIARNSDALHSLNEYRRVLEVFERTPHIAEQVNRLVGTAMGARSLEVDHIVDYMIWRMPRALGGLRFDGEAFKESFHQLNANLKRSSFSYSVLVPLLGLKAKGLPISLEEGIEIDRMTDDEIVRCLGLGLIPDFMSLTTRRIAHMESNIAVRVRYQLPKLIGDLAGAGSNQTTAVQARDSGMNVLHALRVFKEGDVSIPGVLDFPTDWPLQGSTQFTFANPGLMPWTNKYSLAEDEAGAFQLFWTRFHEATSKGILQNAVRRFSYASERERADDQIVDLMIAAESLFLGGPDKPQDRGELRFRLALRAAFFINTPEYTRRQVFKHMRAAYDVRSAIVHGAGDPDPDLLKAPNSTRVTLQAFCNITAELLRLALKQAIEIAKGKGGPLIDWDTLVFGE